MPRQFMSAQTACVSAALFAVAVFVAVTALVVLDTPGTLAAPLAPNAAPVPVNDNPEPGPRPSMLWFDFADKTEQQLVEEFQAALPGMLHNRTREVLKPMITLPHGRNERSLMQLISVDVESRHSVWQIAVPFAMYQDLPFYAYTTDYFEPERQQHRFSVDELPAAEIANIFERFNVTTAENIRFAMWLWAKGEHELSNAHFTFLATTNRLTRIHVEHWLCAKYGWDVPEPDEDGTLLRVVQLHDLDQRRDYSIMLTDDARREFADELAERAVAEIRHMDALLKGTRSTPGPRITLAQFKHRLDRFDKAYGMASDMPKRPTSQLREIRQTIERSQKFIENNFHAAQRLEIDGKHEEAAKALDTLLAMDPMNYTLLEEAAKAYDNAAELADGGRRVGNRAYARRSAELFDRKSEIFPMVLPNYNSAGRAWFAALDRRQAQARLNIVLDRFDCLEEPSEAQKANRDFAASQLRHMGITPRDPSPRNSKD